MKYKKLIICCDGGGASGKSTGAKLISKKFKLNLLNSGLLYRWAAKLIIEKKPKNKVSFLKKKFLNLNYKSIVKLNLHTQDISNLSAIIAKQKKIRNIIKNYQKKFINSNDRICMEGRDSASKILNKNPKYDIAFFFKCNLKTASYRRWKDLKSLNKEVSLKDVQKSLKKRNEMDTKRRFSSLKIVDDAVLIRTDILSKSEMIAKMSKEIIKKIKSKNK
tara:strand:- start:644 stop:1300 length:657 start_codon:yes stop_codon:yes gene_type:complete